MPEPRDIHILLIDNYDSFTFNLKHKLLELPGVGLSIVRNDDDFLGGVERGAYDGVIIGPGPGSPEDHAYFGKNDEVIGTHGRRGLPILGVCLGFQGIFRVFGGGLRTARVPMHGKISRLEIVEPDEILRDVPDGSRVMRYHSILADIGPGIPEELRATSYAVPSDETRPNERELMGLRHRELPIFGVQYHPESFGTDFGGRMIQNFCEVVRARKAA